jgi:hypothetical protein
MASLARRARTDKSRRTGKRKRERTQRRSDERSAKRTKKKQERRKQKARVVAPNRWVNPPSPLLPDPDEQEPPPPPPWSAPSLLHLFGVDAEAVEGLCDDAGYHWRAGKLGPGRTMQLFAWQIQQGNVTCDAVHHHANGEFSPEAYCMARQRVPLVVVERLSQRIALLVLRRAGQRGAKRVGCDEREGDRMAEPRWRGLRVFRIDGTGLQLPDAPEVRAYFGCSGRQRPGCGYPTMHVLMLTGPGGVAVEAIGSPLRTGDMTHTAAATARHLRPGDVVLGDRLFGGWGHLWHLQQQRLHGVFPAHHSRRIAWGRRGDHGQNRRFVRSMGYRDQIVEYRKPSQRPAWMPAEQFAQADGWIRVREIKRVVKVGGVRREVTVVTTLLDAAAYSAGAVVKLLAERWLIETQLRSMKTTMGMERLRCQSVDGVRKELLMYLIVYNLVRLLIIEAAERQGVAIDRISFTDGLMRQRHGNSGNNGSGNSGRRCCYCGCCCNAVGVGSDGGEDPPMNWVDLKVVPLRPGRLEPRVIKQRPKAFPRMTRPRNVLRAALKKRAKTRAKKRAA